MNYLGIIYMQETRPFLSSPRASPGAENTAIRSALSRLAWTGNGEGWIGHAPRRRPTLHPGLDSAMTRRRELRGLRLPAGNVVFQEVRVQQARELDGDSIVEVAHDATGGLTDGNWRPDLGALIGCDRSAGLGDVDEAAGDVDPIRARYLRAAAAAAHRVARSNNRTVVGSMDVSCDASTG